MDNNDSFARSALRHLNISKMFFLDKNRIDTITLSKFVFNETTDFTTR